MINTKLDRLKSQLMTSGLQQKDNPLFQVISQLIDYFRSFQSSAISEISGISSSAIPGGINGNVQYNDSGTFGGASDAVYDKATRTVRIGNQANTIYKLNIVADGLTNQNLLGLYSSNLTAAKFDIFLDGSGNGVWRVLDNSVIPVIKVQVSANGDSFFAGGYVGFTGGFAAFTPSAFVHLGAGSGFAPLKFTLSSLTATPQPGAVEYDGSFLYYTDNSSIRRPITGVDHVPVSTGAEPLQIMSDGAGHVLLVGFVGP